MEGNAPAPLADYFWIAGIETISYQVFLPPVSAPTQVDSTITEDGEPEEDESPNRDSIGSPPPKVTARHSRQSSGNHRLSKSSIHTLEEVEGNTRSNRSSATIRPNPTPGAASNDGFANFLGDFDFDKALFKFAAERENFLEDLSFSAGAKTHSRPPMVNPRTERIKADANGRMSPLKNIRGSIRGSIRRGISFKDMNSVRKQPLVPKAASIRTTKRLSNYNSVIPPPEPLNLDPDMHPLKRRFEPELLDRYPPRDATEELTRRGKFPDYVPMFAFPNDIQIVSSDERPRSTWHGFAMTSDDNSKIYGITVIVWTAVPADIAEDIERRCEQWRQNHMTEEERELAASLGARLAAERAHLSQLLAKLPTIPSGSAARDTLDEQISSVEEKISLMTEMLRPLRHGAASKIDGLTAGESGLWTPRAFGILGRDLSRLTFWKDWLRAVIVPMSDGALLRVPATSPRVGRWQPLERYIVNLCAEAFSPLGSKTQVEIGVRELRLYARKEAENELPQSRSTDIYALFRSLSLENIVALFEYTMSESRIIFLSSHTAMLHLACHALVNLLYPMQWASIFIPILPARLLSALDAPCPYIVGIERRYDNIELPDDDYVLVDLDRDTIDATSQPHRLPKQIRRKLMSLLQIAAPHSLRYGVPTGPPPYAMESFPYDAFSAENAAIFDERAPPSTLGKWVAQNSSTFAEPNSAETPKAPLFNAFSHTKPVAPERPATSKSNKTSPPNSVSPISVNFPAMPTTPISRSDSGFALAATLKEKRSAGNFDEKARRSSSFGQPPTHRPNMPFLNGHQANLSISAISVDSKSSYGGYAPSTYAQSTIAASTIMPNMLVQPVHDTETIVWVEGHCFDFSLQDTMSQCSICDERAEGDGIYKCQGCTAVSHGRCLGCVSLVCPAAFHADKVRAAFVRCQASLLYTYRKYLGRPSKDQRNSGQLYAFDMNGFIKSMPYDQQEYGSMMKETQTFNEFIHERELNPATSPAVRLFDEIILAKKARGNKGLATGLSRLSTIRASHGLSHSIPGMHGPSKGKSQSYLSDTNDHIWRTASVPLPNAKFSGDYRAITTRIPSKLDRSLMKEPRAIEGVPRPEQRKRGLIRKQVPSMMIGGPISPVSPNGF
ncbi:DENN domain-containing protein [Apiospora saccharicola]|uniref:DENN domain-containing protein n=1 Tax=Apiospora saccharicola TaxID=335842 RepID=A0ABR1W207_9PEZI